MAVVTKVRRLVNPHRRRRSRAKAAKRHGPRVHRKRTVKRRNSRKRNRRMTAKQIRYFGSKAQKAALRRNSRSKRKRSRRRNPVGQRGATRVVFVGGRVRKPRRRSRLRKAGRHTHRNPALVVTLGAANPKRRRKSSVARRRKHRKNPSRRRTKVYVAAPKRRRRANRSHRRRRNPFAMSVTNNTQMAKAVVGGLAGVALTKMLPSFLPSNLTSNPILRVVAAGASAFVASKAAERFVGKDVAAAVLFGGLMQTGSIAISAFLPGAIGSRLALSGMGELVNASFPVPQNPLRLPPIPAQGPRVQVNGLSRVYGTAL